MREVPPADRYRGDGLDLVTRELEMTNAPPIWRGVTRGWTQIRTGDTRIFSAVLYLLSYPAVLTDQSTVCHPHSALVGDRGLEPLTSTV